MAWRDTPRIRAASACEIQSSESTAPEKWVDIVNLFTLSFFMKRPYYHDIVYARRTEANGKVACRQKQMPSQATTKRKSKEPPGPILLRFSSASRTFRRSTAPPIWAIRSNCSESLPTGQVNLVVTSPPYALHFKKEYGNKSKTEYVEWFLPFAKEIHRILSEDGSFVLNIGGSYNPGTPTRSLYHFKLLIALVETIGFHLAQECFWYNPAKMPMPAEWVTVRRIRVKDSVEYVWWLAKTPWPKASNLSVLKEYSEDMIRLNRNGVRGTVRPSGHVIRDSFDKIHAGGAIPSNVTEAPLAEVPESLLKMGNNAANDSYTKQCKDNGIKIHPGALSRTASEVFYQDADGRRRSGRRPLRRFEYDRGGGRKPPSALDCKRGSRRISEGQHVPI